MSPRTKNLGIAGGAAIVISFVAVNTLLPAAPAVIGKAPLADDAAPSADESAPGLSASDFGASPGEAAPTPTGSPAVAADPSRRNYAIGVHDLAGLPPDAAPGTRLELWVTWEPPVTRKPRLQKLIADVVLERVVPGTVPEAPVTALISVPADRVGDLIYADGYGRLSVVAPG